MGNIEMFIIIIDIVAGILSAVIIYFIMQSIKKSKTQSDQHRKEHILIQKTLEALTRQSLINACEKVLDEGRISLLSLESINAQFDCYEDLDGNGLVHTIVARANKLPIRKD